jgi:phosphate-selective porin OprO/OprP
MNRLGWTRALLTAGFLACGLDARAQGPVVPSVLPPAVEPPAPSAEDRLRALEQQNLRLAAELAEVRDRLPAAAGPSGPGGEEKSPPARVDLRHGVRLSSADGRFRVEFHDLSQFEGRFFTPTGSAPGDLHNNFDIPRQRLYFAGQVDEWFEFYSVLNRGYGAFDVLDSYVNFRFGEGFNVRVGRTKTPYTYEYYKVAEGDLIAPERSVFVGNLAPNRQVGAMAYGRWLDERVEYAAGVFNGPHKSFQDFNNFKNPFLFVNTRPFLLGGSDLVRHLNVGGSVNFGREDDPLEPNVLRTANDETVSPNADNVSPTFLRFNDGVTERGGTAFWSGDVAWFYRNWTALAAYNGGFITYATPAREGVRVPFQGGSVAVTVFLTGEEITTRKEVEPRRDFDWRDPFGHPGAVELYSRVAYVNAGSNLFADGLADARLWSNDALVLDTGVNWYLNRYVRVFLDWQHSEFGSPVRVGENRFTNSADLFWLRTQLYY